ncbi:hypothetical protein [Blautia wexlerae]|uniref:hypothetical protein n=1 Tax=Blautia wexlerae TaxID=418240 RepID=UPI0004165C89|nr:hypothetical protein [Blautia wexlerae]UWO19328.1 hypothetical protein NQ550_13860 [Blautia wexlerae DSM 19850]
MRLTGIIDYTMDNFLCVRGFASMLQLSEISKADEKIQRDLIDDHRGEMENFLSDGRFTFFPEVILGANMCGTEMDKDKINTLRETVRAESKSLKIKINNIKYVIKRNAVKKENNDLAFDVTQTVIMQFDKDSLVGKEFLRIDGNHRLSAVNEYSTYAHKRIPFCLLLFRDAEETDKFCRALFYNINTKQIPLKMEQNLKVIIESEQAFDDDTLLGDPSFGENYFWTRQIIKHIELSDYPFLKLFIADNKFTYFVEVLKLLFDNKLIKEDEEGMCLVETALKEINGALKDAALIEVPNNLAVIGAFSYYKLLDERKANEFLKWVKKNNLTQISDIHICDVINIYDKIYDNSPKKVFMSMWFNKKTEDTYNQVKDVKEIVARDYNVEIDIIKVDEHKDGYSDVISKRIIDGINSCDLLIADLSYGNKNVHHEIGYAQGKGKKVLLIYQNREGTLASDEIGSNLSMHDQLRFTTYGELREGLLKKIKDIFSL